MLTDKLIEAIDARLDKTSRPPCWLWTAYVTTTGSPSLCYSTNLMASPRKVMWERRHGFTPPSHAVPNCGQPRCVNPEHLVLLKGSKPKRLPLELFWSYVIFPETPDACWGWKGPTKAKGYGCVGDFGASHRLSYLIHKGPIPEGLHVCHHCDNPPCCNPYHLFAGTAKENVQDCKRKGRLNRAKGEKVANAKVTAETVRALRSEYAAGTTTQIELARKYGLVQPQVSAIIRRQSWKHVE